MTFSRRCCCTTDGSIAYKRKNQGAVLCILKPIVEGWDDEGFVLSGQAVNSIYNCVKICIYEGADKYDQFSERTKGIRKQMDAIVESGIEVHGRTFPVRELMGGDTAFLGASSGHAGPSSTHHCHICSQNKMDMALTKRDYRRKGMELPFTKTVDVSNRLAHVFGAEFGLVEPYVCPGCSEVVNKHLQHAPADTATARQAYQRTHFGQRHGHPPINQSVPTLDRIGDNMHAGLQICPQVMWQTIHCNVTTTSMATSVMNIMDEAGIWREVKVMSKAKTPTKAGMPHFDGPELETLLQQRQRLLNVVFPDPVVSNS